MEIITNMLISYGCGMSCVVLSNQSLELYFVMTSHELFRRKVIQHLSFHGFIRKKLRKYACDSVSTQTVFDIESRNL